MTSEVFSLKMRGESTRNGWTSRIKNAERPVYSHTENAMNEAIKRIDPGTEFYTPEQCHIIELSNTHDDPEASIARARVAPGVTTRWHRVAGTTERYVILEGRGRVEVGNLAPQEVSAGDVVLIPPSCRQRIAKLAEQCRFQLQFSRLPLMMQSRRIDGRSRSLLPSN